MPTTTGPAVHADANLKIDGAAAVLRLQRRHGVANRERRVDGAVRRVLVGDRCAEEGHDAVTGEMGDDPLDAIDLAKRERHVLLEQIAIVLGIETLGDAGRADQVAEQHRHELALARDAPLTGANLRRQDFRDVLGEALQAVVGRDGGRDRGWRCRRRVAGDRRAALGAKAEAGVDRTAAGVQTMRRPRAAGVTELLSGDQLRLTVDATHGRDGGPDPAMSQEGRGAHDGRSRVEILLRP